MKFIQTLILVSCTTLFISCGDSEASKDTSKVVNVSQPDSVLRHVVVFKFNDSADQAAIQTVNKSFSGLQNDIPEIKGFEWGLNNSPEGLDQDFTHVYTITFHSEEDRATYLPHPAHKAFVESIGPVVEKAFVVDYWTK